MSPERSQQHIVRAVLDGYGRTFASELGLRIAANTPSQTYRLLVAAILYSSPIKADIATKAARALWAQGWTTPSKLLERSTWAQRAKVLNESGYARYDERTSSTLADVSSHLLERYRGDLRRLREEAGRDVGEERRLLRRLKGLGGTGADIFLREAQVAWDEAYPYVDVMTARSAERLGLRAEADDLARLVTRRDFPRLVAGLVRVQLAKDHRRVREAA